MNENHQCVIGWARVELVVVLMAELVEEEKY